VAVITGGASGIGLETGLLTERETRLVLVDIERGALDRGPWPSSAPPEQT
jgi:NAD(P)-dependent dehydrogenase (short-subunit alcohol dehydrogenase family)